jgi:hypothetical protein
MIDTTEDLPLPTDWNLSKKNINDLQQRSIDELVRRCKQAHFVNVRVRVNGEWEEFEADWLKHLVADR